MKRQQFNKEKTIEEIKDCFITLYTEHSLDQITVKSICEEANISRTIFYHYFDDKYAVLDEIVNDLMQDLSVFTSQLEKQNLLSFLTNFFAWAKEHSFYIKPLIGPRQETKLPYTWMKSIQTGLIPLLNIEEKNVKDFEQKMSFITAGYMGLFKDWLNQYPSKSPKEMAEIANEIIQKII